MFEQEGMGRARGGDYAVTLHPEPSDSPTCEDRKRQKIQKREII